MDMEHSHPLVRATTPDALEGSAFERRARGWIGRCNTTANRHSRLELNGDSGGRCRLAVLALHTGRAGATLIPQTIARMTRERGAGG